MDPLFLQSARLGKPCPVAARRCGEPYRGEVIVGGLSSNPWRPAGEFSSRSTSSALRPRPRCKPIPSGLVSIFTAPCSNIYARGLAPAAPLPRPCLHRPRAAAKVESISGVVGSRSNKFFQARISEPNKCVYLTIEQPNHTAIEATAEEQKMGRCRCRS